MNRLFASVMFSLITTLQIAEAEESRSPTAQEIIIRGKFIAPFAGAIAARYLPVVSIAMPMIHNTLRAKRSAQIL